MKFANGRHFEEMLETFLDGELSDSEADKVRKHCETCSTCRAARDELIAVRNLLQQDVQAEPQRPMWEGLHERLERVQRPRFRLVFALGTSAAAIAGVVLGLFLGSIDGELKATTVDDVWSSVGTTLTDGGSGGLADFFLETNTQEEGDSQ